jgi:hypothetical protein
MSEQNVELMVKFTMAFANVYTEKKHEKKEMDIDLINDMAEAAIEVLRKDLSNE